MLVGRSELDAERRAALDRLSGLGAEVCYVTADVSSADGAAYAVQVFAKSTLPVNGARIATPHPLQAGDELRVGETRLRLVVA